MFSLIKNTLRLYSDQLRFRLQTLRNRRAISEAYSDDGRAGLSPRRVLVLLVAVVALVIVAVVSIPVWQAVPTLVSDLARKAQSHWQARPPRQPAKEAKGAKSVATVDKADTTIQTSTPVDSIVTPTQKPPVVLLNPYLLLVNKKTGELHVYDVGGTTWKQIHTFTVATGANEGRKKVQGDRRTPEGVYFITGRKESSELERIYGPLAYILDYPNTQDRAEGRGGDGIWLHGTDPDSIPVTTRGCVELYNADLLTLSGLLGFGIGTPVVIVDNLQERPVQEVVALSDVAQRQKEVLATYEMHAKMLDTFVQEWAQAWSSRSIERYDAFYDAQRFSAQGLNWTNWRERKLATFNAYTTISVETEKILVSEYLDSIAVVKFIQKYESDRNRLINAKKLALRRTESGWKIYSEVTFPQQEMPL